MKKNSKVHIFYLLLGVGIGLVLGSIISILSPNVKYVGYTEEEIKQQARGLGMYELNEIFEMNDMINEQIEKSIEKQGLNSQGNSSDVETSNDIEIKNENNEEKIESENNEEKIENDKVKENSDSNDSQSQEYVEFKINKGESSEIVINNLFKANIIEEKEEFRKLVYGRKLDRKLHYGKFMIPKGADYTTIIDILTK